MCGCTMMHSTESLDSLRDMQLAACQWEVHLFQSQVNSGQSLEVAGANRDDEGREAILLSCLGDQAVWGDRPGDEMT